MKNRANAQGYIKVSDSFMLDELLTSSTKERLLSVHIDELSRIKLRNDRSSYISKAQHEYLTTLYIDVILNSESFKTPSKIYTQKRPGLQHIGMSMYHALNSAKCKA